MTNSLRYFLLVLICAISFSFSQSALHAQPGTNTQAAVHPRPANGLNLSLQGVWERPAGEGSLVATAGGYGVTATVSMPLGASLNGVVGVGYMSFGKQRIDSTEINFTNFPFFAGMRFMIDVNGVTPYLGAEASVNDLVNQTTNGIASPAAAINQTKIGYALVGGALVPLAGMFSADLTVKYNVLPGSSLTSTSTNYLTASAGIEMHFSL
jgi:opacity protein-like surface antigen